MHIRFFPHPRVYPRRPRAGAVVVVMDVLRATTSMTAALDAGARAVRPCATLAQARRQAKNLRAVGKRVVLAGERGGRKPTGFDRGNSPREFSRGLKNAWVVMATTNGTRALAALAGWPVVLAACLNNVSAVQRAIRAHAPREVLLAAAGDENDWSAEDALCAGMIIRRLVAAAARTHEPVTLDPQARIAWSLAQRFGAKNLHRFLGETPHGQTLLRFGFKDDLRFCARLDTSRRVGRLDPEGWIRPG